MEYKTLSAPSSAKYTEKMSRFLAFAVPVDTVDEVREVIADYTSRYHDARHVCWAYMLGADRLTYQSTDNGEPSGTAGKPILGQINSFGITNVVIVVVRYFGGIKLGTSGLISAYREAARMALQEADIVEREELDEIVVRFPYLEMNAVMTLIKSTPGVKILSQDFDNLCVMSLLIPRSVRPLFASWIAE